jgi:hypothetical protein
VDSVTRHESDREQRSPEHGDRADREADLERHEIGGQDTREADRERKRAGRPSAGRRPTFWKVSLQRSAASDE